MLQILNTVGQEIHVQMMGLKAQVPCGFPWSRKVLRQNLQMAMTNSVLQGFDDGELHSETISFFPGLHSFRNVTAF